jgi:Glycosyl transferase family 2
MAPIRFSIIITFHNQRGFVKDALDSALSQRNVEFEVIVVDDCCHPEAWNDSKGSATLRNHQDVDLIVGSSSGVRLQSFPW